jgi:glycerol-3-phosphate dehydrogenase
MATIPPASEPCYDIAVIGGGVVGCALLRRFSLGGLRCVLLERGPDILSGASKGNSAILHTGFDAPSGSIELACMQRGYQEYLRIREGLNLPLVETGAHVVAWTEAELAQLPVIVERAHRNGVNDVIQIEPAALYAREPSLASGALGAVAVPREHVIDPWSAPLGYALQALAHGGTIHRNCEVVGGERQAQRWTLHTTRGTFEARVVVNAAGLHGDIVEAISRPSPFAIRPRKGQFVVFDKSASSLVRSIILPVPNEITKGVLVCRTAFGNLLVGPTAEEQDARDRADVDTAILKDLIARGQRLVPELSRHPVTAVYAGLRPATEHKDYQIRLDTANGWITVAGIRSTGLTAALGIAAYVGEQYAAAFGGLGEETVTTSIVMPNLCEERPRPWQQAGRTEIICHCEGVTRAEIEAALVGPLPARSLGGLKRRTRCMMGRCQGFYCTAMVAALSDGRVAELDMETCS